MKFKLLQTVYLLLFVSFFGFAQQSITSLGQVYNQDFNTLAITGTGNTDLPANWTISRTSYNAGTGSSGTGAIYSFGLTDSIDRALGSVASGSTGTLYYGMSFTNNTGATITSITVTYHGEMWRFGGSNPLLDTLHFEYSTDATDLTTGTFTTISQLSFVSPDTNGTSGTRNGNITPYNQLLTYTITDLSIANGTTFWVRLKDNNDAGSDDGLAIDDLSVSFSGVVLPTCTTPTNLPSSLTLDATNTGISGTFTKGADADKTIIIYSTSSTLSATPSNTTTYTVGQNLGGGKVAYVGNGGSFSVGGLNPTTTYYVFAFSFDDNCTGGPVYTTTATTANITTDPNPITTTYYNGIDTTLYCADFKTELKNLLASTHTAITYAEVLTAFEKTDLEGGFIVDRYSICQYTYTTVPCSGNSAECQCYNRDHVVPQSWFGSWDNYPMYSDMHHLFPSDGYVNSAKKANLPLGIVSSVSYNNTVIKVGSSAAANGYTGDVFEPSDEYKGDFARTYLYFVTRYQDSIASFVARNPSTSNALDDVSYTGLDSWIIPILVAWHELDPPSQLEMDRNDSVYIVQGNRNPYIDHPEWVERVFGDNGSACLPPCEEPDSVKGITASNITTTGFTLSFNASQDADGYIAIYRPRNQFVASVVDDSTYTVGQLITQTSGSFTDTGYIAYIGTDTTFSMTGLVANTNYYVVVMAYKNCPNGPNYTIQNVFNANKILVNTSIPSNCVEPDSVLSISTSNITSTSITVSFGTSANANGYVVVFRPNNSFVAGVRDDSTYMVGQIITQTSGSFIDSAIVAYVGTNTTFTMTGLNPSTTYNIVVFPYVNCTSGPNYTIYFRNNQNKIAATTLASAGSCAEPNSVTGINLTNITATAITVNFNTPAGGADGYVVVYGNSFLPALRDSNTYTVGQTVTQGSNTGKIGYVGTDTTITLTGLSANTHYEIVVFAYKNCPFGPNYKFNFTLDGNKDSTTTLASVSTGIKSSKNTAFSIYPNPVSSKGIVNIQFKSALIDDASLVVVDVLGRIVTNIQIPASTKSYTLPIENYSKGMYIINVRYRDENSAVPFIVE